MAPWFVAMWVTTTVVVVVTLTLLGREARLKNSALKRQIQEMTLQHAEKTLSLQKELNASAASAKCVLQARAEVPPVVAVGGQPQPASLLLRLLDAEDLAGTLLRFVPPSVAARCGLTCHAACNVFSRRDLVRSSASAHSDEDATERFEEHLRKQHLECVRPGERSFPDQGSSDSQMHSIYVHVFPEDEGIYTNLWTLERKLLHEQTPVFNVISFVQFDEISREWDEHSDVLTHIRPRRRSSMQLSGWRDTRGSSSGSTVTHCGRCLLRSVVLSPRREQQGCVSACWSASKRSSRIQNGLQKTQKTMAFG